MAATGKDDEPLFKALAELDALVGLREVKQLVHEIKAFIEIQQRRSQAGLATEPLTLHMVFKGNPGTGKTTVARILGCIFKELGVLSKGHLVEVERADLVGEYIGHTAQKTREQIKRALGGILFVDEAYSLARGGEKDFGKESIDCLVKAMEDHRDDLVLILAGYREEMEYFLQTNPGLRSRFPIRIDFPDYTLEELVQIANVFLAERDYYLSPAAREELTRQLQVAHNLRHSGNARLVRNIIERAIRRQAVRLAGQERLSRDQLMAIERVDLEGGAAA
ncbi:MAG TPA: AAA family ATPase [Firmicutes bacterium]|nr:AAA family ATPase [Bacillota bacterium]